MKNKTLFAALLSIFFTLNLWAKGIVISDIDDTLKMSHVLSKTGMATRAFMTSITFKGMPELFQEIAKSKGIEQFHYVSNAPKKIMQKSHSKFLSENNYPMGQLYLRENESSETNKLKVIREILEKEQPALVILFGDNGEIDSEVYAQIESEFPSIKFQIFIHYVYGNHVEENQLGHATALEPLIELIESKVLGLPSLVLANKLAQEILLEKDKKRFDVQFFPDFMSCENYQWKLATRDIRIFNYQKVIEKIETRCP